MSSVTTNVAWEIVKVNQLNWKIPHQTFVEPFTKVAVFKLNVEFRKKRVNFGIGKFFVVDFRKSRLELVFENVGIAVKINETCLR